MRIRFVTGCCDKVRPGALRVIPSNMGWVTAAPAIAAPDCVGGGEGAGVRGAVQALNTGACAASLVA